MQNITDREYSQEDIIEYSTCFHIIRGGGLDEAQLSYYSQRLANVMKSRADHEAIVKRMGLGPGDEEFVLSFVPEKETEE